MSGRYRIAVVVPVLNEMGTLTKVVASILRDAPDAVHLFVVDGGSTDGTRELADRLAEGDSRISVLDNPRRIQAAGVNLAVRLADPSCGIVVRADAHCSYPRGWLRRLVAAAESEACASVVVPMETRAAQSGFQTSVAAAQNSVLGNGGARHRSTPVSGWVDHGHHAAFRRSVFDALGGYDETFPVNEDAELDVRIARSGGRIWLESSCLIRYHPRSTPSALARQYYRYGGGRARTVLLHRMLPRPRQVAPALATAAVVFSLAVSPLLPQLLLVPVAYAAACASASVQAAGRGGASVFGTFVAATVMHLAWGSGFIVGLLSSGVSSIRPRPVSEGAAS